MVVSTIIRYNNKVNTWKGALINIMDKINERQAQKKEHIWSLEDMVATNELWKEKVKEVTDLAGTFHEFKGHLKDSAETLLKALQTADLINEKLETVYTYAHMRSHEDMGNSFYQSMADEATSLNIKISSQLSFLEPELLSIDKGTLEEFIQHQEGLSFYKFYLDNLNRKKEHILPEEQEALLAKTRELSVAPGNIFTMLNNADLTFSSIKDAKGNILPVTHGTYGSLLENPDRKVRREAYKSMYSSYIHHKNTIAATYNASIKADVLFASIRNYDNALQASLFTNDISTKVYDNLVNVVNDNLHLMHRYIDLRQRVMGVEDLHQYDLYTPLVEEKDSKVTYEAAKDMVREALRPLGDEYITNLDKGFNDGWIDIYENKGKRSGAYSWGAYGTHPYVLLNHQEDVKSMFTLAHEMGHALHSYYSDEEQEYLYAQYPIFLAEVASTVNESLLMNYMIETTEDPEKKRFLVNHYMEKFRSTLYRQTMFAEFEKIVHEKVESGLALSVDDLCDIYGELNTRYYGEKLVVDDELRMEWARIPHFYRAFYVYQYATGYSAAIAIAERIAKEGEPAVKDYMNFLKAGASNFPLETLKSAGVDMTTAAPVENALKVFERLLGEMEDMLAE